jgi:hypothetical protein
MYELRCGKTNVILSFGNIITEYIHIVTCYATTTRSGFIGPLPSNAALHKLSEPIRKYFWLGLKSFLTPKFRVLIWNAISSVFIIQFSSILWVDLLRNFNTCCPRWSQYSTLFTHQSTILRVLWLSPFWNFILPWISHRSHKHDYRSLLSCGVFCQWISHVIHVTVVPPFKTK